MSGDHNAAEGLAQLLGGQCHGLQGAVLLKRVKEEDIPTIHTGDGHPTSFGHQVQGKGQTSSLKILVFFLPGGQQSAYVRSGREGQPLSSGVDVENLMILDTEPRAKL